MEEVEKCEHWDCPYQTCIFHCLCKEENVEKRFYFPTTEEEMKVCTNYYDL